MQLVVVVVVSITHRAVTFIWRAGQVGQAVVLVVGQVLVAQVAHELELVSQISVARLV
jgi:hypothetical protein